MFIRIQLRTQFCKSDAVWRERLRLRQYHKNQSVIYNDELNAVIDTTEVSAESDLDKLKKQLGIQ